MSTIGMIAKDTDEKIKLATTSTMNLPKVDWLMENCYFVKALQHLSMLKLNVGIFYGRLF